MQDIEHGYLMNVNKQIDMVGEHFNVKIKKILWFKNESTTLKVCKELTADKKLKNGFHAVGFSQGGQFL